MAALARAQRLLAGGGQEHGDAPRGRTITAGLSACPRPCGDLGVADTESEKTGRAPICRSRFLKARRENAPGRPGSGALQVSGSAAQAASGHGAKSAPVRASHARSSSALRKVAQLESKIMNRKKQMELQNTDVGQKLLGEESSSASSHEHGARGKKYLKSCAAAGGSRTLGNAGSKEEESIQGPKASVTVKEQLGLDSDEEEMRESMGSSVEFSSGNKNRRGVSDSKRGGKSTTPGTQSSFHKEISPTGVPKTSFPSKDSEKNVFGRVNSPTPSPAGRNPSARRNTRSQSLSSSVRDNTVKITLPRTGDTKQSQASLASDRSEIKSLDELFSKASDAEDSISSSAHDFRLNILSLDDLAPDITSEAAELKQKETDIQITQESNRNPKKDTFLVGKDPPSHKMTSAVTGVNDASEGDIEKSVTEDEISEHLSGVSADSPQGKQDYLDHDDRTLNSEYSEDFERSQSTTDRESVSKTSEEHSESCTYSGKRSFASSPPLFGRGQREQGHRVTVKETAVQTVDPPFTYRWANTNASAVLDPPVGNSYVDPVPIASHVVSMDAVEALTAYSPSVLVLNSMLKQHLLLTQQFVENIHHLHLSLVESLEKEKFHYHTLEEAKEYIKNHKSPPLTLEQAREEIRKAQEEKLL